MARRWSALAVAGVFALSLSGCAASTSGDDPLPSPSTGEGTRAQLALPAPSKPVTKLLVFVVENHSLDQMRQGMPYVDALARSFGYADHYDAVAHPSLPNYLALISGSTHGIADDDPPADHSLPGQTVFGQALSAGRSAGVFVDGMPNTCAQENGGQGYAVKHNAWAYFPGESEECARHDVPLNKLALTVDRGALPTVGMVVANMCHIGHDCSLAVADTWLRGEIGAVLHGPDWESGHLAVVVTADEDDRTSGNRVLTVVVHPSQSGTVVSEPLDHYSLTGLYDEVAGVPYLNNARDATSMAQAFDLPVPPAT